jgi:3D-(3,5/4)-trihydroxycyclohexane-1,2-dione acylhydrolase (decyclizing)
VIAVATDRARGVPSYESWWDVPVAEVSEAATVRAAREQYEHAKLAERRFL